MRCHYSLLCNWFRAATVNIWDFDSVIVRRRMLFWLKLVERTSSSCTSAERSSPGVERTDVEQNCDYHKCRLQCLPVLTVFTVIVARRASPKLSSISHFDGWLEVSPCNFQRIRFSFCCFHSTVSGAVFKTDAGWLWTEHHRASSPSTHTMVWPIFKVAGRLFFQLNWRLVLETVRCHIRSVVNAGDTSTLWWRWSSWFGCQELLKRWPCNLNARSDTNTDRHSPMGLLYKQILISRPTTDFFIKKGCDDGHGNGWDKQSGLNWGCQWYFGSVDRRTVSFLTVDIRHCEWWGCGTLNATTKGLSRTA